jgi:hypothetical protein
MQLEAAAPRLGVDAVATTAAAGALATLLVWLGPPAPDLAAHIYQRTLFLEHGFVFWNNFWYAGRYSFVTYSLLYYPLAVVVGIKLLAVVSVAAAASAFAAVVHHEWGSIGRWSSRAFALVWAALVLSGAFPFLLGTAFALLALWALQRARRWAFVLLAALTLASSPLAFALLVVILAGVALARRDEPARLIVPAAAVGAIGLFELLLLRMFPGHGHYPFSPDEFAAACVFCVGGAVLTWNVPGTRVLRWLFIACLVASTGAFAVSSQVGENIARFRYAAAPLMILVFSLRHWRPRWICVIALALASAWNVTPLVASYLQGNADPAAHAAYWSPAIRYLHTHLSASYRVEVVDTPGHWAANFLPRAGIPLTRGWYRQEDFPQNEVLYGPLGARQYVDWLRKLSVRYVVLTSAPPDYSAKAEARLLASGRSGLRMVHRGPNTRVFAVPSPRALVTGPGPAKVLAFSQTHLRLKISVPGSYRLSVSYSPYWNASPGCLGPEQDGMTALTVKRPGIVSLSFVVTAHRALDTVTGEKSVFCS